MERRQFLKGLGLIILAPKAVDRHIWKSLFTPKPPVLIMGVDKDFAIGFKVSREMIEDDIYDKVAMPLQRSFDQLLRPGLRKNFIDTYTSYEVEYLDFIIKGGP